MSSSRSNGWSVGAWAVLGAMVLAGGLALAQEGEERRGAAAAANRAEEGEAEGVASRPVVRARRAQGVYSAEPPSDEEWGGIVEFMSRYSPNRLKAVEAIGAAGGQRYASLRRLVAMHYRELTALRERGDQDLYEAKVRAVQKDDEVWALQRQMREASDSDRPVLRWQLKQRLAELVKLGLEERELRIARLEKALAEEKARLAADRENVEARIEERFRAMTAGMRSSRPRSADGEGRRGGAEATTSQVR